MSGGIHIAFDRGVEADSSSTRSPTAFVADIRPRLLRALLRRHRDPDLADDVAQESLTRVLARWHELTHIDDVDAYTFRVAFNVSNSMHRRMVRHQQIATHLTAVCHPLPDADSQLDLERAISRLPIRQRETITRRFYLDASVAETATAMCCAPGTVKAATSHALESLRAALAPST